MSATVLMVEDSPTQAARLMHLLHGQGYGVLMATNARDAIEISLRERPSLIVSDVTMPDMDGYDLCRAIRSQPQIQHIPVLLLTGLSDPEDIINGLDAGADCYLTKPYEDQDLLHRIDFVLKNRSGLHTQEEPVEVEFMGQTHRIRASRHQILGLLLSTYESAASQNKRSRKELLNLKMQIKVAEGQREAQQRSTRALSQSLAWTLNHSSEPSFLFSEQGELLWHNSPAELLFKENLNEFCRVLGERVQQAGSGRLEIESVTLFINTTTILQNGKKVHIVRQGHDPQELPAQLLRGLALES